MEMIDEIRMKVAQNLFELSQRAVDQSIIRHISIRELRESFNTGDIIEDYPDDKYGPSCLIFGFTRQEDLFIFNAAILHVLC